MIDPKARRALKPIAKGLNASPGAASGQIVFDAAEAEKWAKQGKKVLLLRRETSPEDIGGMSASQGILTSTGGMTSHAAVVGRGMGTPCVVGCKAVSIQGKIATIQDKKYKEGDWLTIDGTTGEVFTGQVALVKPKIAGDFKTLLEWADEVRLSAVRDGIKDKGFRVRTNADLPRDARVAREFGAEGVGLTRTEHMFFDAGKLDLFQEMIVADGVEARRKVLKKLGNLQKADFKGIFKEMAGLPVTIRLLDPPLHEFVPKTAPETKAMAEKTGVPLAQLKARIDSLHELNPMLGHRGCRLGITYPEVYDMQVEAIMTAACELAKAGVEVLPEIMIPLVGMTAELEILRKNAERVCEAVFAKTKTRVKYTIGTMIELPRAALTADKIAKVAEFFSFGTNDLTQMTFGFSRDDIGSFLPDYLAQGILEKDPFQELDREGVGQLVDVGVKKGRSGRPDIKVGICGEHGGDPSSIEFCYTVGMNYVSCSPYRVPVARLSAAQAVLRARKQQGKAAYQGTA